MLNTIYRLSLILAGFFLVSTSTYAASLGGVANNMLEPVTLVSDFMGTAAIVVGAGCLFASFFKYFQHRSNPFQVTMTTVVIFFVIGALLLVLPFAYKLTGVGIPYGASLQSSGALAPPPPAAASGTIYQ